MASPLPPRGLAAGFKGLPTQAPPWLGWGGRAVSGGPAGLLQCRGEGWVPNRAESTPPESLAKASFLW